MSSTLNLQTDYTLLLFLIFNFLIFNFSQAFQYIERLDIFQYATVGKLPGIVAAPSKLYLGIVKLCCIYFGSLTRSLVSRVKLDLIPIMKDQLGRW